MQDRVGDHHVDVDVGVDVGQQLEERPRPLLGEPQMDARIPQRANQPYIRLAGASRTAEATEVDRYTMFGVGSSVAGVPGEVGMAGRWRAM
jgi:hypothetical protein